MPGVADGFGQDFFESIVWSGNLDEFSKAAFDDFLV